MANISQRRQAMENRVSLSRNAIIHLFFYFTSVANLRRTLQLWAYFTLCKCILTTCGFTPDERSVLCDSEGFCSVLLTFYGVLI